MRTDLAPLRYVLALGALFLPSATATLIPRLSFEQLTDTSELVVSGRITNTWTAWDQEHKYIWTHYNLSVASSLKGTPATIVEFAEPGGALDERVMSIAGSVYYAVGDNMVVFLSRMPNGYLRTTGWAQGKYALDARGRLHAQASLGAEAMDVKSPPAGSSLQTLEGMSLTELGQRVSAQSRAIRGKNQ
jgi:hypothetical protein